MRKQYHLQLLDNGRFNAWDVDHLIKQSENLDIIEIKLNSIKELDEPFWYQDDSSIPTCRSIIEHAKLINETSLEFPVILSAENRVMDGMHRISKAILSGRETISAKKFTTTPEPDFTNIRPEDLVY